MISQILRYAPLTGKLFWTKCRGGVAAGTEAGWVDNSSGYLRLSVCGKSKYAHVVAWELYHGSKPKGEIDHINGDKLDNRIENLRGCTPAQNSQNKKMRKDNKSGVKGASWNKRSRRWVARVTVNKKVIFLGHFSSLQEAQVEISKCRELHHGDFANHG